MEDFEFNVALALATHEARLFFQQVGGKCIVARHPSVAFA